MLLQHQCIDKTGRQKKKLQIFWWSITAAARLESLVYFQDSTRTFRWKKKTKQPDLGFAHINLSVWIWLSDPQFKPCQSDLPYRRAVVWEILSVLRRRIKPAPHWSYLIAGLRLCYRSKQDKVRAQPEEPWCWRTRLPGSFQQTWVMCYKVYSIKNTSHHLHVCFSSEWCEKVLQEGCLPPTGKTNCFWRGWEKKQQQIFSLMSWREEKALTNQSCPKYWSSRG